MDQPDERAEHVGARASLSTSSASMLLSVASTCDCTDRLRYYRRSIPHAQAHSNTGSGYVFLSGIECKVVKLKLLLSRHNDVLRKYPLLETGCAVLWTQLSRKAKEIDSLSSSNNQLQTQCDKLRAQQESSEYLINQLSYDWCSLERQVDGQNEAIEMLKMSRDDAWSQCSAFIDQYLNIMSLASALGKEMSDKERLWVARQHMWERACSEQQAHLGHLEQEMHDCCRYSNG